MTRLTAQRAELPEIEAFRTLHLQEMNAQVRYDACHARGWSDSWLLRVDDIVVGYGAVKGQEIAGRDTVFEWYVVPPYRAESGELFRALLDGSGARYVECQSNDLQLSALLHVFARDVNADVVLFADHAVTRIELPGATCRPRRAGDEPFAHAVEPVGDYVLEVGGAIVATGGFMLHYNIPFADLYMETREDCRRRGYASFLLQEVKAACYLAGRVPAARCSIGNAGSRASLRRAGMRECGFMLTGTVRDPGA